MQKLYIFKTLNYNAERFSLLNLKGGEEGELKVTSADVPKSFRALIAATLLVVLLLNMSILLPVSPVFAESEPEGQTCSACSLPTSLPTASHHVKVSVVDEEILLQIEPVPPPPPEMDCASCNEESGCGTQTTNAQVTVSELWSYSELTDEASRRAKLISTEITTEEESRESYILISSVEHEQYKFALFTILTLLDLETYGGSFTMIDYKPAEETETTSLEFIELTSTVTLSQEYQVLGQVAKKLGKLYEKSEDENLAPLAQSYYNMREEAKYVSKLVEQQLPEYDRIILSSSAVLSDQNIWLCLGSILGCLLDLMFVSEILSACFVCVQLYTCWAPCFTIFGIPWCIACLAAGFIGCLWCAYLFVGFPGQCYTAGQCLGLW